MLRVRTSEGRALAEHSPLIVSLLAAVDAAPDDVPLRLHVAELLADAGDRPAALLQLSAVLARDPASERAMQLMRRLAGTAPPTAPPPGVPPPPAAPRTVPVSEPAFDWRQAEAELGDLVPPMFVEDEEELIGVLVHVPDVLAQGVRDPYVVVVHLGDDARAVDVGETGEGLVHVDRLHLHASHPAPPGR